MGPPPKHPRPAHAGRSPDSPVDIRLGADLTLETAEESLAGTATDRIESLRVDLTQCRSMDVVALLYIVAVTARRRDAGLATRYRLPADAAARDYLRRRGFAGAIENVADVPFRLLVDGSWFQGTGQRRAVTALADAESAILEYLDDRGFFWFNHYGVDDPQDRVPIIEREGRRWQDPLILELLRTRLARSNANDVPRVIVREMLTNLLSTHATGDVMCVSNIDTNADRTQYLTIAAWHGPGVNAPGQLVLFDQLMSTLDGPGWREVFTISYQRPIAEHRRNLDLTKWARRPRPGRAGGARPAGTAGVPVRQPDSLEALYKHVVDEFDGRIDLWSGTNFAAVSRAQGGETPYRVTVRYDPDTHDTGSIIAVRLPLHHD